MNERIKELEKLATPRCYDETGCYIGNRFDPEKFAELIVAECLDIVADADMTELEGPDPEDVLYVTCKQIREHFGVEE